MDLLQEITALKADYSAAQTLLEEAKLSNESQTKALAEKESALASLDDVTAKSAKDIEALNLALGNKSKELSDLKAELAAFKAKEKTAEEKAVELVANVGIKPMKADYSAEAETKDKAQVIAEMQAMKDPVARANYYFAHKATLFGPGGK